ncbi:MAG: HdeA/HdeB family chaperone [Betaproteobacteria bacterium]
MNRYNKHQNAVSLISALLALSILAVAPAAFAAKTPKLSEWKCKDFIVMDDEYKPKVLYWASSHAHPGWESPEHATLEIDRVEKMIPMVIEECQAEPEANFYSKVKHFMSGD